MSEQGEVLISDDNGLITVSNLGGNISSYRSSGYEISEVSSNAEAGQIISSVQGAFPFEYLPNGEMFFWANKPTTINLNSKIASVEADVSVSFDIVTVGAVVNDEFLIYCDDELIKTYKVKRLDDVFNVNWENQI